MSALSEATATRRELVAHLLLVIQDQAENDAGAAYTGTELAERMSDSLADSLIDHEWVTDRPRESAQSVVTPSEEWDQIPPYVKILTVVVDHAGIVWQLRRVGEWSSTAGISVAQSQINDRAPLRAIYVPED